jgi:CTP-dependent riboflavin kinase
MEHFCHPFDSHSKSVVYCKASLLTAKLSSKAQKARRKVQVLEVCRASSREISGAGFEVHLKAAGSKILGKNPEDFDKALKTVP